MNIIQTAREVFGAQENPYYEKWTVGRPSKERLAKRELYFKWEKENRRKGFIDFILSNPNEILIDKDTSKILFTQRCKS